MNNTIITDPTEEKLIRRYRLEKTHEEYKYLHLLEDIMENGVVKGDRTGTGTKILFGTQLSFDVSNSFPILTTKKVYWKGVVEELLWFIRGETDSKKLEAKGVNIWKGNTSREFLDKRGLKYPEGEIGPCYGFLWRHWGGDYEGYKGDISDSEKLYIQKLQFKKGIDQLSNVINTIKTNPNDRRMVVSAWDVANLDKMALNPCHVIHQYYVENGKLHLMWFQRSNDVFLGSAFNISSYALLLCLIAKITNLQPGTITYAMGDTHLYLNHLEQAKEQISRTPYPFPKLNIKKDIKTLEDIENLEFTDIVLEGYASHAAIKADMAV